MGHRRAHAYRREHHHVVGELEHHLRQRFTTAQDRSGPGAHRDTAIANKTVNATICSTSPRTIESITLDGNMWTSRSRKPCGWVLTSELISPPPVSRTPAPGLVKFTMPRPMNNAIVVTISK